MNSERDSGKASPVKDAPWRARTNLDRLLRSASAHHDDDVAELPPFGFETRVVALWRSAAPNGNDSIADLLRRVAFISTAIIVVASSAAVYEINRGRERLNSPLTNEFAMADSAIQDEVLP